MTKTSHMRSIVKWTCPTRTCQKSHTDRPMARDCDECGWDVKDLEPKKAKYTQKGQDQQAVCRKWTCPEDHALETQSFLDGCPICYWGMTICRRCGDERGDSSELEGCPKCWFCL